MRKLLVILGTNASGKTDLGIRLAQHFGGEIVSADSRQVYRGLDLGSGKITPEEAAAVKHHLIDVADLSETYSVAQFQQAAYEAIDGILAAGRLPLLVGGTGLYISAIVDGYQLVEVSPNSAVRAELEALSVDELKRRLEKLDPEAWQHVDRNNPRRLVRAVENAMAGLTHAARQRKLPRYDCLQLGLTWPREVLVRRIEKRLDDRLARGMIEEVIGLRSRGVSDDRLEKLGLEYRYVSRYLRGEIPSVKELREELLVAIRQFARQQLTWFKRDQRIVWLDPFKDYFEEACQRVCEWRGDY